MIDMKKVFDKRTSVSVGDSKGLARATWPFGRVTLLEDKILVDAGFKRFELLYSEIEHIKFMPFQVQIEHRNRTVPEHVEINGFVIPHQIKRAIKAHKLPIVTV
jgi:hypothetical protein